MKKKKSSSPPLIPLPLSHSTQRRKSISISTSSSSFCSSNSSSSSTLPSPSLSLSPSPYHHPSKPSSVPFSWERKPGVPFTPLHPHYPPSHSLPLPLPPSKLSQKGREKDRLGTTIRRRRKALEIVLALIERLSSFDPYGSCKSAVRADVAGEGSRKISAARRQRR